MEDNVRPIGPQGLTGEVLLNKVLTEESVDKAAVLWLTKDGNVKIEFSAMQPGDLATLKCFFDAIVHEALISIT